MKALAYALLASVLPAVTAQSGSDDDGIRVWAAVAYVNHGDKTPFYGRGDEVLVPEGAQQLWRQGVAFRARYLYQTSEGHNSSLATAPIQGISTKSLDNAQIAINSGDEQWLIAGALAFMQGLYPPALRTATDEMGRNLASEDDDAVEFPLDGYQYPMLQTLSSLDKSSPGIQGTVGCTQWDNQTQTELAKREDIKTYFDDSLNFYRDLVSSGILAGSISRSDGNFWNAYEIYEWVRYMYTHNETVFEGTDNANETINKLEAYALALAQAKLTTPSTATGVSEESVIVTTVAGRTLARKMIDQLKSNIHWRGSNDKLSVLFGSYEPLLSFLSVTGVLTRENLRSGPFSRLPDHGAALVVELISGDNDEKTSDELPSEENLSVRLYYRENTDEDTPFERYSMLGSGLGGQSIPYTSFARAASDDGLSSEEWCTICDAQQAPFCPTAMNLNEICKTADGDNNDASGMYGPDSGRMNPAVAGVIGATVFGAIGGLAAAALYLLAGVRLRRLGPEERSSMIGGFKGPEKRHGDADVEVTSGGAQQERVGSWELRGSDSGAQDGPGAGVSTKEPSRARMREVNQWREDDEISLVGATPVAVREGL